MTAAVLDSYPVQHDVCRRPTRPLIGSFQRCPGSSQRLTATPGNSDGQIQHDNREIRGPSTQCGWACIEERVQHCPRDAGVGRRLTDAVLPKIHAAQHTPDDFPARLPRDRRKYDPKHGAPGECIKRLLQASVRQRGGQTLITVKLAKVPLTAQARHSCKITVPSLTNI